MTAHDRLAYAVAAGAGAIVWISIGLATGRAEAWDSQLYWQLGYPALGLIVGCVAWLAPRRPWRWALTIMLAQAAVMILRDPLANLLPLGLVVAALMALPLIVPAYLGAALGRRAA